MFSPLVVPWPIGMLFVAHQPVTRTECWQRTAAQSCPNAPLPLSTPRYEADCSSIWMTVYKLTNHRRSSSSHGIAATTMISQCCTCLMIGRVAVYIHRCWRPSRPSVFWYKVGERLHQAAGNRWLASGSERFFSSAPCSNCGHSCVVGPSMDVHACLWFSGALTVRDGLVHLCCLHYRHCFITSFRPRNVMVCSLLPLKCCSLLLQLLR
jgi:hypothetical protein